MQKIRIAGIVAEYNPFHRGHQWMIHQLRAKGCEAVVCVMSGAFVQRAEPALFPPHLRARAAVAGGADLVLRLPLPWAVASAEGFAEGATGLLAALGCVDTLAFGAETADTLDLEFIAGWLETAEFRDELKKQLATGVSFATARARAVAAYDADAPAILARPNNILGIEYCKALNGRVKDEYVARHIAKDNPAKAERLRREMAHKRQNAKPGEAHSFGLLSDNPWQAFPRPLALPRKGAAHDADAPGEQGFASASWLRKAAREGGAAALAAYVPGACLPLYQKAFDGGEALDPARWELALLARLKGLPVSAFARYEAGGDGLEARIATAAKQATGLEELYALAKSKRFAHSRVRRLALATALRLPTGLPVLPPFAQVLAANQAGLALLKKAKTTALVPVGTSLAKLARTGPDAGRLVAAEAAAEDLYALCQQRPRPGGGSFTRPAAIERN